VLDLDDDPSTITTHSLSMSSGSAITAGPGRPLVTVKNARETSPRMRAGSSISVTHLAIEPNTAIVELLERLALAHLARDLADEQNHWRRILARDVQAPHRIGGARPAGRPSVRCDRRDSKRTGTDNRWSGTQCSGLSACPTRLTGL